MTAAPERLGPRVNSYDATACVEVREQIRGLHADGAAERLDQATGRPGFRLVTAAADSHVVGYAAASLSRDVLHLDPVMLSPALSTLEADQVCRTMVDALLSDAERPWLRVAVPPASVPFKVLLRLGWRPVKTPHDSAHVLLSTPDPGGDVARQG